MRLKDDRELFDWTPLASKLLEERGDHPALPVVVGTPGLLGVVKHGHDPRRVTRWITKEDASLLPLQHIPLVDYVARGPAPRGQGKHEPEERKQISIDLLARAHAALPQVARWDEAYLWVLALPTMPRLEELRLELARMKGRLLLCCPSSEQYRGVLRERQWRTLDNQSLSQRTARYRQGLNKIPRTDPALELSLLAALVAESWITDQEELLELHREAFSDAVDRLLSNPWMADLRDPFKQLVAAPILLCQWQMPAAMHVSSLDAPFLAIEEWKELTGIDTMVPFV